MRKILHIIVMLTTFWVAAQNEALFTNATDAYNEGNYDNAVENYLKIIANGQHSAELYFNLGNSYYKLNQVAPSIYYFEKALLLKPKDTEIASNLAYAKNMTLDAIESMPQTGFSKMYESIVGSLSFDQWAYTAIGFMLLFVSLYIAFYYFRYAAYKRIAFISGSVALLITMVAVLFAYLEYGDFKADQPAIVFADQVTVKSEPNERSQEVFKLHEGTKLNVVEELKEWKKIRIADGQTGWLLSENIKTLKDF